MIGIQDLIFEYPGHRALHGVTLSVERGAITALVGPNGAGKTTLLRCMAALETPYAGRVTIDGLDTREAPRAIHARLGYLPDFFGLYDALSVRRCLYYAARAHGIGAGAATGAVEAAAGRVGLGDRMEQAAGALSRGLRQRLAIAQALVHRPSVLLLDEPAAGLDPQARRELSQLLLSLKQDGMTLVVSSHILAELEDYSDRMIIVDHGRIAGGETISLRDAARTRLRIVLAEPHDGLKDFLRQRSGVEILADSEGQTHVSLEGGPAERAALLAALVRDGFAVAEFTPDVSNLEDVYFARVKAGPRADQGTGRP